MARTRPRIENHHAEWLSLVETSGPFLTVPTLKRVLPDGLDAAGDTLPEVRVAHAEWRDNPALQQRWLRWVLDEVLELADAVSEPTDTDPTHRVAEQNITLRPSLVVRDQTRESGPPVLLVHTFAEAVALDRPVPGDTWAASPIDRAAELARASGVQLALVTNGSRWTLVWARPGEATGTCTWRSDVWLEEVLTFRAFVTCLGARRFFVAPEEEGLARLLEESASKQQEVADQLGSQVRRAVELLIATLDRADRDRHGALLKELDSGEVYRGAVTLMMRLVFLFVAEERRLLPMDNPRYAETLAASTLRAHLQERADRYSENVLESSNAAWYRVLALFRAVHGGIEHDELRLPAYGGGLFDPDRYPFLEGRPAGTAWRATGAQPLPVDDRTMLHILDSLQTLEQGGARVLLSYQSLDVEQIGHVYEGLLDHTALRQTDTVLALDGKIEPEISLGNIETWANDGPEALVQRLAKETGRSPAAITKALNAELDDERRARLRAACGNDDHLTARVQPYATLLRDDLRGDPLVFLPGAIYVTQAMDRRSSGTYYTPRTLAEEVVRHTLDPISYSPGPAEEADAAAWRLRPPAELLDLKIADIAMGSGAFLVAACRYLAARLLEAWEALGDGEWTVFGHPRSEAPDAPTVPADPDERQQLAHRLVTERCLYGVDRNPMAVEMAKMSLWLITLARDRPFSFLDHALRPGDSLLGVTDLRQLRNVHMDPNWARQATTDLGIDAIDEAVSRALDLRRDLESFTVRDVRDASRKSALLARADEALEDARLLGDVIVGAALAQADDGDPFSAMNAVHVRSVLTPGSTNDERATARKLVRAMADTWLTERQSPVGDVPGTVFDNRRAFHWALEFPEVWARGGFDAIVGNPPFQGGKRITGALGTRYRDFIIRWLAGGVRGNADLVAYFYLRAATLVREAGTFGLIATNTIAQGDTREVGLDQLADSTIHRAIPSAPWPGGASLEMAVVWVRFGQWAGRYVLDGAEVRGIDPTLTPRSRVAGNAERLKAAAKQAFIGSFINGMGFVLAPEEAEAMLQADPRNQQVVRPYLVGEDLNTRPDGSASRYVIDFGEMSEEEARQYQLPFAHVETHVLPERRNKDPKKYPRMVYEWWKFWNARPGLYGALRPLRHCIALARVSKVVQPMRVPTGIVFSDRVVVFAYDDHFHFGVLASGIHWWWGLTRGSTLETRPLYNPTDCFETFVQPAHTPQVAECGRELDLYRADLMLQRQEGLTKTYNRVHDPDDKANDVDRLRSLQVALDTAVGASYGWTDIDLAHDFHETKLGIRFTLAPSARQEVLDRLLELNQVRYAEETKQGLHGKKKSPKRRRTAVAGAMTLEGLGGD